MGYAAQIFVPAQHVPVPNSTTPPPAPAVLRKVTTTTTTSDTAEGSNSKKTESSTQTSSTVVSVLHHITENGDGGFLNALGVINYVGKTVTLKVVNPSTSSTSYKNDTESATDFVKTQKTGTSDSASGVLVNGVPTVPASSGSQGSSEGGSTNASGGDYGSSSVVEVLDSTAIFVSYKTGAADNLFQSESFTPMMVQIDLAPYTTFRIVPGSIRFTWMGMVYEDFEGVLYMNPTVSSRGTTAGMVDYLLGIAYVTDYVVSGSVTNFQLNSMWVHKGHWTTSKVFCRTASAPVKPGGFVMSILDISGQQITATSDIDGVINGPHCHGNIDYQSGVVDMIFGDMVLDASLTAAQKEEWWYTKALAQITAGGHVWKPWPVDPNSLRYNSVSYFYLPLDADIIGIDPVRLPQDGRVPIFRPGGFAVMGNTQTKTFNTVNDGDTLNCDRNRLSRVRLLNADNTIIPSSETLGQVTTVKYTADLDAGTISVVDKSGWILPIKVEHRIEDMVVIKDAQVNGLLEFTRPLTHEYPLSGSYLSSALVAGNLQSRVSVVFDQATWDTEYKDIRVGPAAEATFDHVQYPIAVKNRGAVTEKWIIHFLSNSTIRIIGENLGQVVDSFLITTQNGICRAENKAAGTLQNPAYYFEIDANGFGGGWLGGNMIRFNTIGAQFPVWVVRTVMQGPETIDNDSFSLLVRGDVDAP